MKDDMPSTPDLELVRRSLANLEERFEILEKRIATLEGEWEPVVRSEPIPSAVVERGRAEVPEAVVEEESATDHLGLIGRTLVVLGGAYLLRAITEFAVLPGAIGSAIGFSYAMTFLWLADRDAAAGKIASARFHGWLSIALVCAIVWESATRFEILPPFAAAAVVLGFSVVAFEVAGRRKLHQVAGFLTLASGAVLTALVVATKTIVPYGWALLALVVLTIRTGRTIERRALASISGLLVDGVMLILAVLAISDRSPDGFVASTALLTVYFVFFAVVVARRVVVDRSDPSMFGIVHVAAATVIGALGAMRSAMVAGSPVTVGMIYLAMAPVSYSFGFAMRSVSRRAFSVFTTLGLVLVIAASTLTLPADVRVVLWLAGVFVAWVASSRQASGALDLQITVYLWAAAAASGILGVAVRSLVLSPEVAWGSPTIAGASVMVCALVACLFALHPNPQGSGLRYVFPRVGAFALLSLLFGGVIVMTVVEASFGSEPDPALVALLRMALVAATAIGFAWLSRRDRFADLALLVYPILALGAMKLLAEDLRVGRPVTLFITFALCGGVLIVMPRLRRKRDRVVE